MINKINSLYHYFQQCLFWKESEEPNYIPNKFYFNRYKNYEQEITQQLIQDLKYEFKQSLKNNLQKSDQISYEYGIYIFYVLANQLGANVRVIENFDLGQVVNINKKTKLYQKVPKKKITHKRTITQFLLQLKQGIQSLNYKKTQISPVFNKNSNGSNFKIKKTTGLPLILSKNNMLSLNNNIQLFIKNVKINQNCISFYSSHFRPFLLTLKSICKRQVYTGLTIKYCNSWTLVKQSRRRLKLTGFINYLLQLFSFKGPYSSALNVQLQGLLREKQALQKMKLLYIPKTQQEFKNSNSYCLVSSLKSYEYIEKNAVPLQIKFNQQLIYLRSNVLTLKSKTTWEIQGFIVRKNQKALKTLIERGKSKELFSENQVESAMIVIKQDGSFETNDYGNNYDHKFLAYPQFLYKIAKKPYLTKFFKKHKFIYCELVNSFKLQRFSQHPVKQSILIYKKDQEEIQKLYKDWQQEEQKKKNMKLRKELLGYWKLYFKKQRISRQLSSKYQMIV